MTKKQAQDRIEKLKKEIDHHRYLYHVHDKQEISDAALDSLKYELVQLEKQYPELVTPDSPTQRVSGKPLDKFFKVRHSSPVLSLEDAFTGEDLADWQQRNEKLTKAPIKGYYNELKFDGLSVVLTYENGTFVRGATRGDGITGEDVTQNLKTIEGIPLKLNLDTIKNPPKTIEVRGEVVMSKKDFAALNRSQAKKKLSLFANPRNVAAGSIRQLDSTVTAARNLDCFIFELKTDLGQTTHSESHDIAAALGFKTSAYNEVATTLKDVERYLAKWEKKRDSLPYNTDGVVVVVNDIAQERSLGSVGKADRWMIAYKFPAEQSTTKVEDIIIQVGRTGALTPVAVLTPVRLAGTTVSRATLHNEDEIRRLDIRVGDTIIVQKAGDIIPDVVKSMKNLRNGKEKKFRFPTQCPVCNSSVVRPRGEVAHYCTNKKCYAQESAGLIHFVSRKGFDIEGMGTRIVEQLMKAGLVHTAADFFALTEADLKPLERFADKSAENLIAATSAARKITLPKFLYSLGIRHVGEGTALVLAEHYRTLDRLMQTSVAELENVSEIGTIVAQSIVEWFAQKRHKELLQQLKRYGVTILPMPVVKVSPQLKGKKFVLTGSLEAPRDEVAAMIRRAGGSVSSSVSVQTDYVVVGHDPGSKLQKARSLEIKMLSYRELMSMLKKA